MNHLVRLTSLLIVLISSARLLWGGVIADCAGMTYAQAADWATNQPARILKAVVLPSPFRAFDKSQSALNGPVYDFTDTGGKFQRGGFQTYLGDETGLQALSDVLSRHGMEVYARLNLFNQAEGYNRAVWNGEDFIPEILNSGGRLILDVRNAATRGKLGKIIGSIRRLPVRKWVADVRDIPEPYRADCARFLSAQLGSGVIIISSDERGLTELVRQETVRTLANGVFSLDQPDFQALESVRYPGGVHFVDSDGTWVNLTAAVLFLVLKGQDVLVSSRLISPFTAELLEFARTFRADRQVILSRDRMMLSSSGGLVVINFADSFGVWTLPKVFNRTGLYKAVASSSVLSVGLKSMEAFLFPKSIAFWRITGNR